PFAPPSIHPKGSQLTLRAPRCWLFDKDRLNTRAVMAALVAATHALGAATLLKTWVPGTSPGMTQWGRG
ncbi:hypothetical protein, partial [Microvirga zambiensis]|uniref:hypothetical protein n=1 Tax=Microvirga zambiensis TaxID=1402137 RepID=UPI001AEF6133